MMSYTFANEPVTDPEAELGLVVHHPLFGIALQERMEKLGIECVVHYRDPASGKPLRHGGSEGPLESELDFIRRHFEKAGD